MSGLQGQPPDLASGAQPLSGAGPDRLSELPPRVAPAGSPGGRSGSLCTRAGPVLGLSRRPLRQGARSPSVGLRAVGRASEVERRGLRRLLEQRAAEGLRSQRPCGCPGLGAQRDSDLLHQRALSVRLPAAGHPQAVHRPRPAGRSRRCASGKHGPGSRDPMSAHTGTGFALGLAVIVAVLSMPPESAAEEPKTSTAVVPLTNPVGEGKGSFRGGLFRTVVTARGFEIDDSRAGQHQVRAVGSTNTFTPDAPAIYVVVEFLQSTFDIFRLVGRFILEDPNGKPVGTVLHVDRAQFENEDMGGYLMTKQASGGLPIGNYRVKVHHENDTDRSRTP